MASLFACFPGSLRCCPASQQIPRLGSSDKGWGGEPVWGSALKAALGLLRHQWRGRTAQAGQPPHQNSQVPLCNHLCSGHRIPLLGSDLPSFNRPIVAALLPDRARTSGTATLKRLRPYLAQLTILCTKCTKSTFNPASIPAGAVSCRRYLLLHRCCFGEIVNLA